jgi:predicted Ser/Thr protein kinase
MATEKQKQAARKNIKKAQAAAAKKGPATKSSANKAPAKKASAKKASAKKTSSGAMTEAARDRLSDAKFAFPDERKEPLNDAKHVRNAIARFDQVEDVSDAERERAWKRIKTAAKKFGVEIEASGWRELMSGGKARKR